MKKLCMAIVMVLVLPVTAVAATNYNVCFNSLDADLNGTLSKSEFMVAFPQGDTKVYEAADNDQDGGVSHEEWEEFKASKGWEENH